MRVRLEAATMNDVRAVARLRTEVADQLTRTFGRGHWSSQVSDQAQARLIEAHGVFVARQRNLVVATLRLQSSKPWAIDAAHFTEVRRPLYLTDMAVAPDFQRCGIGRSCMAEAARLAREWPADAIRLDAYDAPAGAGPFYAKCGLKEAGRVVFRQIPLIYYELLLS